MSETAETEARVTVAERALKWRCKTEQLHQTTNMWLINTIQTPHFALSPVLSTFMQEPYIS
jgi:hypothetical protein